MSGISNLSAKLKAFAICGVLLGSPAFGALDFDQCITEIRRINILSPEESWGLIAEAEKLLEAENPSARFELQAAMAPAVALRRGEQAARKVLLDFLDEAYSGSGDPDSVPLLYTALADLAYRHADIKYGFSQVVEGARHVESSTSVSTRLLLLEQAIRLDVAAGFPFSALKSIEQAERLGAFALPEWRDRALILKAEVLGACGDYPSMRALLAEFSNEVNETTDPLWLRAFWIQKAFYALMTKNPNQMEEFLFACRQITIPGITHFADGRLLFLEALHQSLKGVDVEPVRNLLEQSSSAFQASGQPGIFPLNLTILLRSGKAFPLSHIGSAFHEAFSTYAYPDETLIITGYACFARAGMLQRSGRLDAASQTVVVGQQILDDSVRIMDEYHLLWDQHLNNIGSVLEKESRGISFYLLTLVLLFIILVLVLVLRIRTQRHINAQLRETVEKSRIAVEAAKHANLLRTQFLSNVSHEIKTPMSGLVGMTSILQELVKDPSQRKYLDTIGVCSRNLLVLINDLLELSRMQGDRIDLEKVPFNLSETFTYCEQMVTGKASEKGILLNIELDESLPSVLVGDSTRFGQVLINILNNAIKFTESGSVTLTARYCKILGNSGRLEVSIEDTGIGILPERLNTVFEPFNNQEPESTKIHGGSGLGLAISKKLVDLMGGTITVESVIGKGSTFTVILPFKTPLADVERP